MTSMVNNIQISNLLYKLYSTCIIFDFQYFFINVGFVIKRIIVDDFIMGRSEI